MSTKPRLVAVPSAMRDIPRCDSAQGVGSCYVLNLSQSIVSSGAENSAHRIKHIYFLDNPANFCTEKKA
jgi:hypothetical protein